MEYASVSLYNLKYLKGSFLLSILIFLYLFIAKSVIVMTDVLQAIRQVEPKNTHR